MGTHLALPTLTPRSSAMNLGMKTSVYRTIQRLVANNVSPSRWIANLRPTIASSLAANVSPVGAVTRK
jgi:hypothetical protein